MAVIQERIREPRTQPAMLNLNADAVLYSLDHDRTLDQLDDAHHELDRRAREQPARAELLLIDYVMVTDDEQGSAAPNGPAGRSLRPLRPPLSPRAEPEHIAALRHAVVTQYRAEVQAYARRLRVAIQYQLCILGMSSTIEVNVGTYEAHGLVQFTPLTPPPRPMTRLDQAIADAIALTWTPAALPGTLLTRAEAEYAAQSRQRERSM